MGTQASIPTMWCWLTGMVQKQRELQWTDGNELCLEPSMTQRRTRWGYDLLLVSFKKHPHHPPTTNTSAADQCLPHSFAVCRLVVTKRRETGRGARSWREWLLEVGHIGTDVIWSDMQRGGMDSRHCLQHLIVSHTETHTHVVTLRAVMCSKFTG